MLKLQRRQAVGSLATLLAGALTAGPAFCRTIAAEPVPMLDSLRQLTDRDAAEMLCRYLPENAEIGRSPQESCALIAGSAGGFSGPDLCRVVSGRIRQDHADGLWLVVGGWTLALTEARLLALWRPV